ncbi:MAG: Sir2 family NAD-dependent protein deacetylase, partial [Treponemataceae bacterium]|nr:Sir2 family NAD-dependent protein deacetylase [Treponemataceae bacterium]
MEEVKYQVEKLQKIIDDSENIVFFGGAGVSTESGIPDFRSVDGLYHQEWDYPPEVIISHSFFEANPKEFYRFYKAKLLPQGILPNKAHKKLAEMEKVCDRVGFLHNGTIVKTVCTKQEKRNVKFVFEKPIHNVW